MNIFQINRAGSSATIPQEDGSRVDNSDRQLSLNFADPSCRLFMIAVTGSLHGRRLTDVIDKTSPRYVVDLRDVLRFDLPGLTRNLFFNNLSSKGVNYTRVPMRWHDVSPRALTVSGTLPPRLYHEAVEQTEGNLVLLVSRPEHALHTHALLNMALSINSRNSWRIEQAS
jgi:hypothetical protein